MIRRARWPHLNALAAPTLFAALLGWFLEHRKLVQEREGFAHCQRERLEEYSRSMDALLLSV